MKRIELIMLSASMMAVFASSGCNLTGGIDSASNSNEDIYSEAEALLDQGECGKAVAKLSNAGTRDDRMNTLLGWAHMCNGGAPFSKVASTLLTYSSSSNDLTIVGKLANKLVPMTNSQIESFTSAINAFASVTDASNANDKAVNGALAHITKAAAIIAMATTDGIKVRKADISASTCANQTCTSAPAGCTATSTMPAANANLVGTELIAAASSVGSNSALGAAQKLAAQLGAAAATATQAINTCTIYNQIISND